MSISKTLFLAIAVIAAIDYSISARIDLELGFTDDRIIGGEQATRGQFPYQISLRGVARTSNGTVIRHRCGGSILNERWIVTAAHCTQGQFSNGSNLVVFTGAHHIADDGESYTVERVVNYPAYNGSLLRNDIALIRTREDIALNDNVQAIPLRRQVVDSGVRAVVSGWGQADDGRPPTYLKFVHLYTIDNEQCRARHDDNSAFLVNNSTICASLKVGHGACFGDSGGPLVAGGRLIGIVSWGYPCARGRPDAFTRVSLFVNWIAEVTGVHAQ